MSDVSQSSSVSQKERKKETEHQSSSVRGKKETEHSPGTPTDTLLEHV